jgi:hypothetical protein
MANAIHLAGSGETLTSLSARYYALRRGHVRRTHAGGEHACCLPSYLFPAGTLLRADPAAVPVSHALNRHRGQTVRNHPMRRCGQESDLNPRSSVNACHLYRRLP